MPPSTNMCQYQDCRRSTGRRNHNLCREHYYESQDGLIGLCPQCGDVYKPNEYTTCRSCFQGRGQGVGRRGDWPEPSVGEQSRSRGRLTEAIEEVRQMIHKSPTSLSDSERATEQFCVDPILVGLGCNTKYPDEFVPQQRVSRGRGITYRRVDFALHANGVPVVFVEVKK